MIINREKLKKMMTERGMNNCDLAKRSGLSECGVRQFLKKEGHNVTTTSLEKLAKGFRLTYEELVVLLENRVEIATGEDVKDKKIQELERELKKAKRKLEPKDRKLGIFLRKTDLEDLRLLAQKNNMIVSLFIERVLEKALDNNEELLKTI